MTDRINAYAIEIQVKKPDGNFRRGSGFPIGGGYIVTCFHVVEERDEDGPIGARWLDVASDRWATAPERVGKLKKTPSGNHSSVSRSLKLIQRSTSQFCDAPNLKIFCGHDFQASIR